MNNGAAKILVVDDEPTVREVVVHYLQRDGYVVHQLDRGDLVHEAVTTFQPDLIVLDIMLPGLSGLDVLRAIGPNKIPVIMLTARVEEADRVLGLELGADDYVTKPFSPRELVARVRTVLRRAQPPTGSDETIRFDDLTIERRSREVTIGSAVVALTAKEFDLLAFLAASPRQVFSRSELLHGVWDSSPEYQDPDRYYGILGGQLDNIESLLDQLVEYARIESGHGSRERTTVSIAELAHEAVEALSPVAHRLDVEVQLESDGPAVVTASTTDMSRVLRNLLENAIRHSPSGGAVGVAVRSGSEIEVCVRDQGPGFPDDFRQHAFEPFTRADPARNTRNGHSGLGLAIARALVEAHGGRIWLGRGAGADVRFSIPRKEPA